MRDLIDRNHLLNRLQDFIDWCRDGRKQGTEFCIDVIKDESSTESENKIISFLSEKNPEEQYEFITWLLHDYGGQFTDSRKGVIDWLSEVER